MDFRILDVLGFSGTGLAVTTGVLMLFWKADDAFSEEFSIALSQWLQRLTIDTPAIDWATAFSTVFDSVFGVSHFSWSCFLRSMVASTVAYVAIAALCASIGDAIYAGHIPSKLALFLHLLVMYVAYGFIVNTLVDYVSLLETRYVISRLAKRFNVRNAVAAVVVDLALTHVIYVTFFFAIFPLFAYTGFPKWIITLAEPFFYPWDVRSVEFPLASVPNVAVGLMATYATTLFTSAWLWLFVVGWMALRNAARFQLLLKALQFTLPIKTKPMRAIGEVAALATGLGFLLIGIIGF
jgi:hypothetical protein